MDQGKYELYLAPGVQFKPVKDLMLRAAVPVIVDRHMNGSQPSPNYKVVLGFIVDF